MPDIAGSGSISPRSWDDEDRYWQQNYTTRPYASGTEYKTWQPAYRYGYESAGRYSGKRWEDVEDNLRSDWDRQYGTGGDSTWQRIKDAVRDGWDRMVGNR